jgi:hypothetical protein
VGVLPWGGAPGALLLLSPLALTLVVMRVAWVSWMWCVPACVLPALCRGLPVLPAPCTLWAVRRGRTTTAELVTLLLPLLLLEPRL